MVAELFREKPERWGFRGDPYLWEDLEQSFKDIQLPYQEEHFLEKLYTFIEQITGERLEIGEDIDVEIFDHEGLSSEKISYEFWINQAIPLLVTRLNKVNQKIYHKYNYGKIVIFPIEVRER